jgi:hypothetical protein
MSEFVLSRILSRVLACPAKCPKQSGDCGHGLQDKSADRGRAHVVGRVGVFCSIATSAVGARQQSGNKFNLLSACPAKVTKMPRHADARQ